MENKQALHNLKSPGHPSMLHHNVHHVHHTNRHSAPLEKVYSDRGQEDQKLRTNLSTEEFLERARRWQQKRDDHLEEERAKKEGRELEGCTFHPETHDLDREALFLKPSGLDLSGLETTSDYKIVFGGKTYDLSTDHELREFFTHSIDKSGNSSIFRKNFDKLNKIYSVMLK